MFKLYIMVEKGSYLDLLSQKMVGEKRFQSIKKPVN